MDAFGESALDVIENQPEELCKIRGISDKKAREISASFRRQMGLRRLLDFLPLRYKAGGGHAPLPCFRRRSCRRCAG